MKRLNTPTPFRSRWWQCLGRSVAFVLLSSAVASPSFGVQASDDHFLVYILDSSVTVTYADLLSNDQYTGRGSVSEQSGPRHGVTSWSENAVTYFPDETFWAVGSDSLTYRVATSRGNSTATVYWVAERPKKISVVALDFESANDPFVIQHAGLSIAQGSEAILGHGSLRVDVSPQDPGVFGSVDIPLTRSGSSNGGDLEICLVGGSGGDAPYTKLPGDQGYLVLLGQLADTTPEQAVLRVGVAQNGNYFLEVREVNSQSDTVVWHRSEELSRQHLISNFQVSYRHDNGKLAAVLRTEGLVARIDAVPFDAPDPTHFHLGYFQPPGGGGNASILIDQVRVERSIIGIQQLPALLDPLQLADSFEDGTTDAWTAEYGSGLILDVASSLTGYVGLGISNLAGGPSFVSFQPRVDEELLDELSAELRVDLASFAIVPGYQLTLAGIRSASDPLFGDPSYQLRVKNYEGSLQVRAFYRAGPQTWLPEATGAWFPVTGSTVLRLQVGKGDGEGAFNGWMRLWADGEIVQEHRHLDNYDQPLRTVHFGAKSFSPQVVSGTLRFDDLNVTR